MLFRTTAIRLTALYVLLFGIVAAGLAMYMVTLSVSMLTSQTRQSLQEEVAGIEAIYNRGGIILLMRTIDRRIRQPGAFLYVVTDPFGRILAGNVRSIEPGLLGPDSGEVENFQYSRYGDNDEQRLHKAIGAVIKLPNGMKLLVGRDLGEPQRFTIIIRKALLIAFAAMAVGAFLIWFFIGRRALHRIDNISRASQRLMDGDLSGRLPVSGSEDEFDRLSENLNIMLERMEELNTGLRQVSDNIAHDLKTPLTRLRNRAEEALAEKKQPVDMRAVLEDIIVESDQLIRTFNAMLLIARIEAGQSAEALQCLSLRPIIEDAIEFYEPVAEEKSASLCAGEIFDAPVKINRELVAQSVFNLVDNALKYGCNGQQQDAICLSMERRPHRICIVVSDNGTGIPAAMREKVMERFFRMEASRTMPGAGIGLSFARAVMKFHGGELLLEDAEPGLRAVLAFPVTAKS